MTQAFRPEAAFAGAAERFFELMKSFAPQPSGATGGTAFEPAALAGALARQYEDWLRATQSAGSWFGAPGAGAGATAWPFAPLPLGMGAAAASEGKRAWELIAQLAQLQAQLAAHWHEIAAAASQQFIARLGAGAGAGEAPTLERSLELYELWVDCAERAYAATVNREDFAGLQSQLMNVSAALLLEQRRNAESIARAFGLPTRSELDALYAQLKDLQRRLGGLSPAGPVPAPSGEAANEAVSGARATTRSGQRPARGAADRKPTRAKSGRSKGGRGASGARGRRA